jgi:hypothetical protein
MLKKQVNFLFTRIFLTKTSNEFVAILGTVWLLIEATAFFFPEQIGSNRLPLFVFTFTSAFVLSLVNSFPKLSYSQKFRRSNIDIVVKVSDILEEINDKECNIIIGINNGLILKKERLIGSQSLKSQITHKFYQGKSTLVDQEIANVLTNKKLVDDIDGVYEVPIGSVAILRINSSKLFFLVNKEKRSNKTVKNISKEDFWLALCNVWEAVKNNGYNHPVVIPVLGAGLGRAPASRISLVQLILTSFAISNREFRITSKLTVVIDRENYSPEEMLEISNFIAALDL